MKKFNIILLFILFIALSTKSQVLIGDVNGRVVSISEYTNVNGFPYLLENWVHGIVNTENGRVYDKLLLKYNLVEDVVYFKGDNDKIMRFIEPIKSFNLDINGNNQIYSNGFPIVDNFNSATFFQILYKNINCSLLLKKSKTVTEAREYSSAVTDKNFSENFIYYIFRNGKMEKFKPSKKEILTLFSDKSEKINDFIKSSKIDFKSNEDLAKVFDLYYSSK